MQLPFTIDQFFEIFARYNEAIWPLQWLLVVVGASTIRLSSLKTLASARAIAIILGILWIWTGAVYHVLFFRAVNPAATAFGALFIAEGALFLWVGAYRRRLVIADPGGSRRVIGALMALYALLIYPAIGYVLGHRYPEAPTFGAPCPTTILTFGLLVWATPPLPRVLLIAPVLWALVGTSVVWQFGMLEDLGLPVAAIVTLTMALRSRRGRPLAEGKRRGAATLAKPTEAT